MKLTNLLVWFLLAAVGISSVYALTLSPTTRSVISTTSSSVDNVTITPWSTTSLTPLDDVIKSLEKKDKVLDQKINELSEKIDKLSQQYIVKNITVSVKKDNDYAFIDMPETNNNPNAKLFVQLNDASLSHRVWYDTKEQKWFIGFQSYVVNGFTCDKSGKCIASAKRLTTPSSYKLSIFISK